MSSTLRLPRAVRLANLASGSSSNLALGDVVEVTQTGLLATSNTVTLAAPLYANSIAAYSTTVTINDMVFDAGYFVNGYACKVYQNGTQSLAKNAFTVLTMTNAEFDYHGGMANTAGNAIDIRKTGNYFVVGKAYYEGGGAATNIYAGIDVNDAVASVGISTGFEIGTEYFNTAGPTSCHYRAFVRLNEGDYIKLYGYHNATAGLNFGSATTQDQCFLAAFLVGT